MSAEPEILVHHREELAELLTEAVEIEHNLMCCYLYAAWSLKHGEADGLTADQARDVEAWREAILAVAIDEMAHMANALNLLSAIGSGPRLARPNFPISPGAHPADIVVHLRRFDRGTLDHFAYLERPEGVDLEDGEGFAHEVRYHRVTHSKMLMPTAQDYATVGHLYRAIRLGIERLVQACGHDELFIGEPDRQIRPEHTRLEGLVHVTDLASALQAIDNIVEQGEGHATHSADSHYNRFCAIRDAFRAHHDADSDFDPARPVPENPVQRNHGTLDRVWIHDPDAAALLDLCNATYNHMLRMLGVVYGDLPDPARAQILGEAIGCMRMLGPLNELLTRMPAGPDRPGLNAGMSFAVTREIRVPQAGRAVRILVARTRELAHGARELARLGPAVAAAGEQLLAMAARLEAVEIRSTPAIAPAPVAPVPIPVDTPAREVVNGVEIIQGEDLELRFDTHRCIHARHCVLGAPRVFLANVEGPWIHPDAMDTEALAAVARNCPSGAITYTRKDGGADEPAPEVNRLNVRENGPLAVHADLHIAGQPPRHRAVLCRCGKSNSKPFCDNSHKDAGFTATGEPPDPSEAIVALSTRDGVLNVNPSPDGPLLVSGNLELCSGTGRTFAKKTNCALCRCGGSANKPFCDGTHRRIGFKST